MRHGVIDRDCASTLTVRIADLPETGECRSRLILEVIAEDRSGA